MMNADTGTDSRGVDPRLLVSTDYWRIIVDLGVGIGIFAIALNGEAPWFGYSMLLVAVGHTVYFQKRVVVDGTAISVKYFLRPFMRHLLVSHNAVTEVKWQSGPYTGPSYAAIFYSAENGKTKKLKVPIPWSSWPILVRLIKKSNMRTRFVE